VIAVMQSRRLSRLTSRLPGGMVYRIQAAYIETPVKLILLPTGSEWQLDAEIYVALRSELDELGYTTEIVDRNPDSQKCDPLADLELHFGEDTPGHAQADALAKLVRRRLKPTKHFSLYGGGELLRQGWSGLGKD